MMMLEGRRPQWKRFPSSSSALGRASHHRPLPPSTGQRLHTQAFHDVGFQATSVTSFLNHFACDLDIDYEHNDNEMQAYTPSI